MLERTRGKDATEITFMLPADQPIGPVSVVGDFNDWQPGAHQLTESAEGIRTVTVTLPADRQVHFRYLAHGGLWFDDQDTDGHDGTDGYLYT